MARSSTKQKPDVFSPSWSTDLRAPLYHQLFLILRNKILSGEYPDGSFLPGEAELAQAFGVSRITTKRALNEIAEAGFAVRQRGRGTRVLYNGGGTIVSGGMDGLRDSLRANARGAHDRSSTEVLEFGDIGAVGEVAKALQVAAGTLVQHAVRVCSGSDGKPYSHLTTFVPQSVSKKLTRSDYAKYSLVALIEKAGARIESAEQIITATLADGDIAKAMQVDFAGPLLKVTRIAYSRSRVPVEYLIALYPPGRYHFIMSLTADADVKRWTI